MIKNIIVSAAIFIAGVATANDTVTGKPSFEAYIQAIKTEAFKKGYSSDVIESSFKNVTFHKRAVKADKRQPEKVETLDTYLPKRVANWKIKRARSEYKKHKALLTQVGEKYGVQPRFIVALWGLETNFGKIMGN
jgi:membrane-bound lytic murein transglycosylase B